MWVPSATSMRNSLSTGRALGGRNRHPERVSTRGVRSWGYTSLGIEGIGGASCRCSLLPFMVSCSNTKSSSHRRLRVCSRTFPVEVVGQPTQGLRQQVRRELWGAGFGLLAWTQPQKSSTLALPWGSLYLLLPLLECLAPRSQHGSHLFFIQVSHQPSLAKATAVHGLWPLSRGS